MPIVPRYTLPNGSVSNVPQPTAAPAAGPPGTGPNFNAEMDPRLVEHADRLKKHMDDPMGSTGRAIDVATGKIRDASEGRRGALRSMLSKRGALGNTSGEDFGERQIAGQEGRDVAASASGIALQRERDNDQFMLSASGAMGAPGAAAARDRAFGLDAWQAAEANRRANEAVRTNDFMRNLDVAMRLGV